MEKENKENICVAEFFYLLGLFVVNRTANSPYKSFVLCKYITTVTFHVSSLAKPPILSSAFHPNWWVGRHSRWYLQLWHWFWSWMTYSRWSRWSWWWHENRTCSHFSQRVSYSWWRTPGGSSCSHSTMDLRETCWRQRKPLSLYIGRDRTFEQWPWCHSRLTLLLARWNLFCQ